MSKDRARLMADAAIVRRKAIWVLIGCIGLIVGILGRVAATYIVKTWGRVR